jgi:hypothetical protein
MYDVVGNGELGEWGEQWDSPSTSDTSLIEEYHCDNCGEYFTPTKRYDLEATAQAWQAAIGHLEQQEVSA